MVSASLIQGELAWYNFEEIRRVVQSKYSPRYSVDTEMRRAIQSLGENVLAQYNLDPKTHVVERHFCTISKIDKSVDLSTIEKMVNASFPIWQDAIESVKVGHDTYTTGRKAGYIQQKSIQQAIDLPFEEAKHIVDMPMEAMVWLYARLTNLVQQEMERTIRQGNGYHKNVEIIKAINLLAGAINYKYQADIPEGKELTATQKSIVDKVDLYSNTSMLDIKIGDWSLRQALNLARIDFMFDLFGMHEVLWGKSTSLINVEKRI